MGDGADGGNVFNHSIGAPISAQYWVTERYVCVCVLMHCLGTLQEDRDLLMTRESIITALARQELFTERECVLMHCLGTLQEDWNPLMTRESIITASGRQELFTLLGHRERACVDALSWYSARGLESSYDARVYNHSIGAPRIIHITGAQSIARGLESSMALILLCISQCSPCNLKF